MSDPTPSPTPTPPETTAQKVATISGDVATVAGVAASLAPLAGPYGLIASTVLSGLQLLANEAPAAYAAIAAAINGAEPTAVDWATLRANVNALSLDS